MVALWRTSHRRILPPKTTNDTGDPVVVTAGDIASCFGTGDEATPRLFSNIGDAVPILGDNAYEDGAPEALADCYDPSWGRYKNRTEPFPR